MKSSNLSPARTSEYSDILEALKFELDFLEHGGYGRSVRTPWKPTSLFQDSPTCLNFNDPARSHPCTECFLINFVPPERRGEDVPCHHIPLDKPGQSIASLSQRDNQEETEEALREWVRTTIRRLEELSRA